MPVRTDPAGEDGRLAITYEIVYGHAFAPTVRRQHRAVDGSVTVPLTQIRPR